MSHEIKLHEAQTSILRELLFLPSAGFAELQKPTSLASDHFTFHINRLVEIGLVERMTKGKYQLTVAGKEYANRLDTDERTIERQAKIAVLIVPTRTNSTGETEYMIQKRLKQPFYGRHCFMTGKLRWAEQVLDGAARELMEETGMTADLNVAAIYHKMDYDTEGVMLEDKHFYVIKAPNPTGDMMERFDGGENYWYTMSQILALENVFSGMDWVIEIADSHIVTFHERSFTVTKEEY